jgi:hypothetical protein
LPFLTTFTSRTYHSFLVSIVTVRLEGIKE